MDQLAVKQTISRKVQDYITDQPRRDTIEIAAALDIPLALVRMTVSRLATDGAVRRIKEPGMRRALWEPGSEDDGRNGKMKQTTVTTWEPHLFRDPLVALLYPQPIQQEQA